MPTIRGYFPLLLASFTVANGTVAMAMEAALDVACEIRSRQSSGDLRLEAVATSHIRTTGEYDLVIVKSGVGGTLQNHPRRRVQSGPETGGNSWRGNPQAPGEGTSAEATLQVKVIGTSVCDARFQATRDAR